MVLCITGNRVDGNFLVDASIINSHIELSFINNLVCGDVQIKASELVKNIDINGCRFIGIIDDNTMPLEVRFMYQNFFVEGKQIKNKVFDYARGQVGGLTFYLPQGYQHTFKVQTMGVVIRCMDFLVKYAV